VPSWATAASASPASGVGTVATDEGTNSDTFTNLATSGPAVTLTTGTKVLVIVSAYLRADDQNGKPFMDYAISGATTRSASETTSLAMNRATSTSASNQMRASSASRITVTAGSNVFTAKYKSNSTSYNVYFANREIFVMDLGS